MSGAALRLVEGSSMDKSKALDAALSQIERSFGKGSIMRLGKNMHSMDIETVSTGSLGLDIALGIGGLPRGRVVEIYGPESSGKTTLALHVLAEAQKNGGICAFSDADPITKGADALFLAQVPGTRGQAHPTISGAGHFLQEDSGPALADAVTSFVRANPARDRTPGRQAGLVQL